MLNIMSVVVVAAAILSSIVMQGVAGQGGVGGLLDGAMNTVSELTGGLTG